MSCPLLTLHPPVCICKIQKPKKWNWFHFQNADIGLGAISVMNERERVIDFTYPFYEGVGMLILMQKIYNPPSIFRFV